eukprot:654225_1
MQVLFFILHLPLCLGLLDDNYNGHSDDIKKSYQIVLGQEFDSFPEFYHLPQRHANIPWFGSKFEIRSAKYQHKLATWSEHNENGHAYLCSTTTDRPNKHDSSMSSIWTIEPGFHKHSVVIKDEFDRKLGVDHVNDSFNNIGIIVMKTVTHISSYSWFIQTNKYGKHHGLVFESMKHKHLLSIDKYGVPYTIHHSLRNQKMDGWTFQNVNYSEYNHHQELIKNAKQKWHDQALKI